MEAFLFFYLSFRLLFFYLVHCCLVVNGTGETDAPVANHASLYLHIRGSPCAGPNRQGHDLVVCKHQRFCSKKLLLVLVFFVRSLPITDLPDQCSISLLSYRVSQMAPYHPPLLSLSLIYFSLAGFHPFA